MVAPVKGNFFADVAKAKKIEIAILLSSMVIIYAVIFFKTKFKIDLKGGLSLALIFIITLIRFAADFIFDGKDETNALFLV